jgi:hypothetical protein
MTALVAKRAERETSMIRSIYPNFLSQPQEYDKAEAVWKDRWQQLLSRAGESQLWKTPWLNSTFADGTPCRDGNPILSSVCTSRRLGVQVIQHDPKDGPDDFVFWTDTFAEGQPQEVRTLVISCVLNDATIQRASELLEDWINRGEVRSSLSP